MHYGSCKVTLPERFKAGTWEGSWIFDDAVTWTRAQFMDFLLPVAPKLEEVLVHIHGFKTPFAEALRNTALLAAQTDFPGLPVLFSWPSGDKLKGYERDGEKVVDARHRLYDLLTDLRGQFGAKKVHVLAHSMGSRAVTASLTDTVQYGLPLTTLGHSILVAPDMDFDDSQQAWGGIQKRGISLRNTVYVNDNDRALLGSELRHEGRVRAGRDHWLATGIDCIDASSVQDSWFDLNHSYHHSCQPVIDDLSELIRDNHPPDKRSKIRVVPNGSANHYVLRP
jgi:esterase/lipase superfamily enzyme